VIQSTHASCTEQFCRAPLHPGPCKGWKRQLDVPSAQRRTKRHEADVRVVPLGRGAGRRVRPPSGVRRRPDASYRDLPAEAQAQERQRVINAALPHADLAAQIDQMVQNGGSARALRHTLSGALGEHLSTRQRNALLALVDRPEDLRAAVRAQAAREGVEVLGRTEDAARFDQRLHESIGPAIAPGAPVTVVRPGARLWIGEDVLMHSRMQVQE